MDWFRIYHDIIDDPKILRLSREFRWSFVEILAISSRQRERGTLPEMVEISLHMRVSEAKAERIINELIRLGFIDKDDKTHRLTVHGWDQRQFKSDDISHRSLASMRRSRERSRERSQGVHVNVTDTDTDTETDNTPPIVPPLNPSPRVVLPSSKPVRGKVDSKPFIVPDWITADDWVDFEEMRKRTRKPMTNRARDLVVKELVKLRSQGHQPSDVLAQSIRNNWQDVFPIRQSNNGKNGAPPVKRNMNLDELKASEARIAAGKARTQETNRLLREALGE